MGILRFRDLDDWQHAVIKEQHDAARDPDDAGPIGTRALSPILHTATWIQLDPSSGQLVYGPEMQIEVYRGHDKDLPEALQQKLGMRGIRGWFFQVRKAGPNPQPESFALFEGKEILLSKLPHSRNYFMLRKLKPCKHEKSVWDRVARAWDKYADMPLADERLDRLLQELSVTPFMHSKGCLAAWAVTPKRFDVLGHERFDTNDDYTLAALEIPFAKACELLQVDPALAKALHATEEGSLFHDYQRGEDVKEATRQGLRPPKGPVRHSVTPALRENSRQIMEAACWAALCGRVLPDAGNSVAQGALLLYHRFAYNFVEREADLTKEKFRAHWRKLGYDASVQRVNQIVDHVLRSEADGIGEDAASGIRAALAGWPPEWKKPADLQEAMRRLSGIIR